MPIERERIDVSVRRWMDACRNRELTESSLKAKRIATDALLRAASADGVLYARDLRRHHFDAALADLRTGLGPEELKRRAEVKAAYASKSTRLRFEKFPIGGVRTGRSQSTLVADRRHLRQYADYCKANNWMAQSLQPLDPDANRAVSKSAGAFIDTGDRRVIPFEDWPKLLDIADDIHPRTRILIACGLLWGRRVSEVAVMQFGHLNFSATPADRSGLALSYQAKTPIEPGSVLICNVKRQRLFTIPIGPDMAEELDRWMKWLQENNGPIQPEWHVAPPRVQATKVRKRSAIKTTRDWPVDPTREAGRNPLTGDVKRVLSAYGWPDVHREGLHTLRRSLAAHLDSIGEIKAAQALLDHEKRATTEVYSRNRAGQSELKRLSTRKLLP